MTWTASNTADYKYRFTLRPQDSPKTIRLVVIDNHRKSHRGAVLTGIYEIVDDELKLCLPDDPSTERPNNFEAPAGSHLSVLVLRRQSETDKASAEPSDETKSPNTSTLHP